MVVVVMLPHRCWMGETELETFDLKVIKSLTMKALWDPGDLRNNFQVYMKFPILTGDRVGISRRVLWSAMRHIYTGYRYDDDG